MSPTAQNLMNFLFSSADVTGFASLDAITEQVARDYQLPFVKTSAGEVIDHSDLMIALQQLRSRKIIRQDHRGLIQVRFPEMGAPNV